MWRLRDISSVDLEAIETIVYLALPAGQMESLAGTQV